MGDKLPIRVLLVDDHKLIRDTLARLIRTFEDMELVAQATNGREAIEAFAEHQPDITLMDVSMPVVDGLAATRLILQQFPQARIIILSVTYDKGRYHHEALAAGAAACLGKDISVQQLAETIREVHYGAGP
jgi:DNA-binding NarL/FixJ family response regulator